MIQNGMIQTWCARKLRMRLYVATAKEQNIISDKTSLIQHSATHPLTALLCSDETDWTLDEFQDFLLIMPSSSMMKSVCEAIHADLQTAKCRSNFCVNSRSQGHRFTPLVAPL